MIGVELIKDGVGALVDEVSRDQEKEPLIINLVLDTRPIRVTITP